LAAPDESPPTPFRADLSAPDVGFGMRGHIDRTEIPGLCVRLQILAAHVAAQQFVCDVGAIVEPDAVTVDALARLQLTARRLGREVRISHASRELQDLLALMGLSEAVPLSGESGVEARRQPEEREVARGVQEEDDPADPAT
jgi:ABC-type transporter Mla MlaB component